MTTHTSSALVRDALRYAAEMTRLRRDLHLSPEAGLVTPRTRDRIRHALAHPNVTLVDLPGDDITPVVAVVRGRHPGGVVLLRVDVDARVDPGGGITHDCGHDTHAAWAAGATRLLADRADHQTGTVLVVWQPGSETGGGAATLIDAGLLDIAGTTVTAAYSLRALPCIPRGQVAVRRGVTLTGTGHIRVDVTGPDPVGPVRLMRDPMGVACHIAASLDQARVDTGDPLAVTVDTVTARGGGPHMFPTAATISATVRSHMDSSTGIRLADALGRLATGVASGYGMHARATYLPRHPATVSRDVEVAHLSQTVAGLYGRHRVHDLAHPVAISDDFGHIAARVPSAIGLVGVTGTGDDGMLPTGAAILAGLATRRLAGTRVTPATIRRPQRSPIRPTSTGRRAA